METAELAEMLTVSPPHECRALQTGLALLYSEGTHASTRQFIESSRVQAGLMGASLHFLLCPFPFLLAPQSFFFEPVDTSKAVKAHPYNLTCRVFLHGGLVFNRSYPCFAIHALTSSAKQRARLSTSAQSPVRVRPSA